MPWPFRLCIPSVILHPEQAASCYASEDQIFGCEIGEQRVRDDQHVRPGDEADIAALLDKVGERCGCIGKTEVAEIKQVGAVFPVQNAVDPVAGKKRKDICAAAARNPIISAAARDAIIARISVDYVVIFAADDMVITIAAAEKASAISGNKGVVAILTAQIGKTKAAGQTVVAVISAKAGGFAIGCARRDNVISAAAIGRTAIAQKGGIIVRAKVQVTDRGIGVKAVSACARKGRLYDFNGC